MVAKNGTKPKAKKPEKLTLLVTLTLPEGAKAKGVTEEVRAALSFLGAYAPAVRAAPKPKAPAPAG